MISSVTIKDFKSITEVTVDLGQINVFIGANGSGKSNILEAVGVLSAAASGVVDDESLLRRGVRPGVPLLYKTSFRKKRISSHIFIEARNSDAEYSVSLNNTLKTPQPCWLYKTENLKTGGESVVSRGVKTDKNKERGLAALKAVDLSVSDPAMKLLSLLSGYSIYTPSTDILRGIQPDSQTRSPVGLNGGRLAEALRDIQNLARKDNYFKTVYDDLLQLIDWASRISVSDEDKRLLSASISRPRNLLLFEDRFMVRGRNTLTAFDASEGALYVLYMAALAVLPDPPAFLAVDNMDQFLNPRLARKLVNNLCKWTFDLKTGRQFVFTAHNPSALDGLDLTDNRIRLFSVNRNNRGFTTVTRVELPPDKDWPLSRLWVNGMIQGIPSI
ncbi:chromosome segregation protein SMC [Candidatus Fermentibacteria bacterium]|nr:MAG: chromosome segregation protein SMC [Candidatus Fermentibacteria bacterium]